MLYCLTQSIFTQSYPHIYYFLGFLPFFNDTVIEKFFVEVI